MLYKLKLKNKFDCFHYIPVLQAMWFHLPHLSQASAWWLSLKLDVQYKRDANEANFFDGIRARQTIPGEL